MSNRIRLFIAVITLACAGLPFLSAHAAPPFGLETRVPLGPLPFPTGEPPPTEVAFTRLFPRLSFTNPLYVTVTPENDERLFVLIQNGRILIVDNVPDPAATRVFLDISAKVKQNGGEEGLLGLAFHPQYASNGFFYVYYTPKDAPSRNVLARYRVSANPEVADPASETILLSYTKPFSNHNGGCLQFGPDGKLYIAVGDGGSGGDPNNNAQNNGVLMGKMLRLNPDGSVPADNPFVGVAGARPEIWALGLRNPWRFSFDAFTGKLWLGDVGQGSREEVDIIRKGGNYGWRVYEGDVSFNNPNGLPPSAFDAPVFVYDHSSGAIAGQSITGGYVYRGAVIPGLAGQYIFADFVASKVFAANVEGDVVQNARVLGNVNNPASFGSDNAGNLYIASFDGGIYRLDPGAGGGGQALPAKLSQTALFSDLQQLEPAPGVIPYSVNSPFWSDGARKQRWMALRNQAQIGFTGGISTPWTWPLDAAVLVKHFDITLANGANKRLETRVLFKQGSVWQGITYRWNGAGTDADLLTTGGSVELDVRDLRAPGGHRLQTYEFPSSGACAACHNAAAGYVLGLRTGQMNRRFSYPNGVTDNQLRSFNHVGYLSTNIGSAANYPRLAYPANGNESLSRRARSYLDANCAQCHRPGGPTPVTIDLRASVPRGSTGTINAIPTSGDLGIVDARIIAAGSKERSVLWQRMRRLDDTRMPPLSSHVVDRFGVNLIGQWIDMNAP